MSLRLVTFGILWLGVMLLLFTSPIAESRYLFFNTVPARSFIHLVLFWGFTHLWICALKKQLKYEFLRSKAFLIVFGCALVLAAVSEVLMFLCCHGSSVSIWNFIFDMIGAVIGIVTFRVLYASCY